MMYDKWHIENTYIGFMGIDETVSIPGWHSKVNTILFNALFSNKTQKIIYKLSKKLVLLVNQNVKSAIYGSSTLIEIKGIEFR